jgi:hypothetical protein
MYVTFLQTVYLEFYVLHEIGETSNECIQVRTSIGKSERSRPLETPKSWSKDIKTDLKNRARETFIHLAQNTRVLVNTAMRSEFRKRLNISLFYHIKFRQGRDIFLFPTAYRSAMKPAQPAVQWVRAVHSPGHDAEHTSTYIQCPGQGWWSYTLSPRTCFLARCLINYPQVQLCFKFLLGGYEINQSAFTGGTYSVGPPGITILCHRRQIALSIRSSTLNVVPSSLILPNLMMEATYSSEMSVLRRATRCHVPVDGILHTTTYNFIFAIL